MVFKLVGEFKASAIKEVQENAVKQNITTLHNRVNELGVAEPVIQQQGQDRIIVQLPGVQDTARAKDIIGRTATLESRLADPVKTYLLSGELPPPGSDVFKTGDGRQVVFKKSVIFSGDRITSASAGFDNNQRPSVNITLDSAGGRVMQEVTRENIGKPMGMILFEKGRGEVLTVATIQSEFGSKFQITGQPSTESANDLALLLRAGSLAAPMEIIEELEPTRRGPYAGAVGYFSFSGNMDMCINIRTVVVSKKRAFIQAGAGIVADSNPEYEYEETCNKARAMMKAIELAEQGLE